MAVCRVQGQGEVKAVSFRGGAAPVSLLFNGRIQHPIIKSYYADSCDIFHAALLNALLMCGIENTLGLATLFDWWRYDEIYKNF